LPCELRFICIACVTIPFAPLHPTLAEEATSISSISRLDVQQKDLLSFALPVLDNLSFKTFAKVLDEEADTIASFRSELKQLVISAKQHDVSIQERYQDVVRPAIERVERRFRATQRMHSVRAAGAALASIGVNLTALTSSGVTSSVAPVLGPAGLGLLAKEIADFMKAREELRELPFYLHWRLEKARSVRRIIG
jgi:transposase